MKLQQNIEYHLWDYIDNRCSFEERMIVKRLIANDEKWNKKYHELTGVHHLLTNSLKPDKPSSGFLQKVMEKITAIQ
jgi:hypothetical protein